MSMTNAALVRAEQPSLHQRNHLMHTGKQMLARLLVTLNLPIVAVSHQFTVRLKAVCADRATRFDRLSNESVQGLSCRIRNSLHPYTTDFLSSIFDRNDNQGFAFRLTTDHPFFFAAPIGFIDFDRPRQAISARSDHRPSKFVQPSPGGRKLPSPNSCCKLIALAPFFWQVTCQAARNHIIIGLCVS